MTGSRPHAPRPPQRRCRALFVLAVLAGLLGMHALAPGGGMGHPGHEWAAHGAVVAGAPDDCMDGDGHCGGHRPHHADPSCASAAVDGGPQLPAPVPDPLTAPAAAPCLRSGPAGAPEGARAPPDLSELQLLRI
ncbi:hypothetical protein JK359_13090 [Streptomyces actinomycinicus]|uniref:DUF1328 domain-containing protein n=1 Tax=Streptomyces actinomycinicus TaxID=1695166 RepID=A0A937EIA8_9ACTN|nr:DUF6153 family protein [Streptomyces actinomycinicus]MBL1082907.1 hypothetical protein [Streptomyces actinomycinicus]